MYERAENIYIDLYKEDIKRKRLSLSNERKAQSSLLGFKGSLSTVESP